MTTLSGAAAVARLATASPTTTGTRNFKFAFMGIVHSSSPEGSASRSRDPASGAVRVRERPGEGAGSGSFGSVFVKPQPGAGQPHRTGSLRAGINRGGIEALIEVQEQNPRVLKDPGRKESQLQGKNGHKDPERESAPPEIKGGRGAHG